MLNLTRTISQQSADNMLSVLESIFWSDEKTNGADPVTLTPEQVRAARTAIVNARRHHV